jgi:hypothetical protein
LPGLWWCMLCCHMQIPFSILCSHRQ